jgi:hypothetical protein
VFVTHGLLLLLFLCQGRVQPSLAGVRSGQLGAQSCDFGYACGYVVVAPNRELVVEVVHVGAVVREFCDQRKRELQLASHGGNAHVLDREADIRVEGSTCHLPAGIAARGAAAVLVLIAGISLS